jgi:hypothetical protein
MIGEKDVMKDKDNVEGAAKDDWDVVEGEENTGRVVDN